MRTHVHDHDADGVGSVGWQLPLLRSDLLVAPFTHGFSTRAGGTSPPPFDSLNLGAKWGDHAASVAENRRRLASAVGWGALPNDDGLNSMVNYMAGDLKNISAEVEEAKYPLRVACRALEPDSGGAGQYRGGLALIKEYQPTAPGCRLLLWLERTVTPGWGVAGGQAGRTARCIVDPDGAREVMLKKANHLPIPPGTTVRCFTAGGGGYGPPWKRDIQRVLDDLSDGYITRDAAASTYGLRFQDGGFEIDAAATNQARLQLAQATQAV
jgi:N-methylhydantoinase B/oxoprolinase/acetone carboxylase alpha subunit